MRRLLRSLVALAVLAGAPASAEEPSLEVLERALEAAHGDDAVARALDDLTARIGSDFADAGAFADWLGRLPEARAGHRLVALRRGWALVAAHRGAEALPVLDAAIERGAPREVAQAYRAGALRQTGRREEALAAAADAVRLGFRDGFAKETALNVATEIRRDGAPHAGEGLPAYVEPFERFLSVAPDAGLHATLGRWLLDDRRAFAPGDSARSRRWIEAAARSALAAVRADPSLEEGIRLALDAGEALTAQDAEARGATPRYDLLAHVVRSAETVDEGAFRKALVLLAQAALAEGRYELAARLARRRLEISDSPAARRILDALPPDLGD